ncbi:hypothetical protein [Belnapia rosea]|uniref:VanZ like family protein n=1 Tax=Belnapia rosea TaxID=938405 RepID=A0A1G6WX44_9PROT|nr:hypothetical protein [Belnapia rosea]SDB68206.1 hypothetical protein SAMN02927895_03155 [Belnapia rosea]SDD70223.1 hypothetical protein SAMN04487779_101182 [Belnapia rosea]
MALLTAEDWRRQSWFAWLCLLALAATAAWFWSIDRRGAAAGTLAALAGCLGLILPPRERMPVLPARLRALPRRLDATPVLATLLVSPGFGLNWFYGANAYDEVVHLVNGALAGAVFIALFEWPQPRRGALHCLLAGAGFGLVLGVGWEVFEALTGLIGDWTDTWTDVVLTTTGAALAAWLLGPRLAPSPLPAGD